jgi:hypothetical protein
MRISSPLHSCGPSGTGGTVSPGRETYVRSSVFGTITRYLEARSSWGGQIVPNGPCATPKPTPDPNATVDPNATPGGGNDGNNQATAKPGKTPKPTAKPGKTPKPTAKPDKTPKPTPKPTKKPTPKP